jgi:hypothetical protein
MQVNDTVYTRATQYYTKGKQDTANEADGVFADSLNNQVATVTTQESIRQRHAR